MRCANGRGSENSIVVKIFAATFGADAYSEFVDSLRDEPDVDLIGKGSTGGQAVEAIRDAGVDALVFAENLADLARTLRLSAEIPLNGSPSMVICNEKNTTAHIVRSVIYGFDGFVSLDQDTSEASRRISAIVNGDKRLSDEPVVRELGIQPGLLVRGLIFANELSQQVADLVGAGLDDDGIAYSMGISVQQVRNQIELLLHTNKLASRTHLAVARASHVVIPDFA